MVSKAVSTAMLLMLVSWAALGGNTIESPAAGGVPPTQLAPVAQLASPPAPLHVTVTAADAAGAIAVATPSTNTTDPSTAASLVLIGHSSRSRAAVRFVRTLALPP